jgi:hypothetical protein
MKRVLVAAGALAMVTACSQAQTAQPAKLSGARSMALVGDLILVTSTERNELRVLDLLPPVTIQGRQFLPGPNPLQALSIPVLDRPTRLGRDLSYASLNAPDGGVVEPDGLEVGGPYVYASSPGTAALSIVDARDDDPQATPNGDSLVEVARLPTPAPVTATAGTFDPAMKTSVLYFATDDGTGAGVYEVPLPAPGVLNERRKADAGASVAQLLGAVKVITRFTGVSVADLLALPGRRLVVATRDQQGKGGQTVVIDLATSTMTPLDFGAPVRVLVTHAATTLSDGTVLPAGARIYGLLDEGVCGGPACGGVVAVDSRTGARVIDYTGKPMPPLTMGEVLPVGLSILARAPLNLPVGGLTTLPLLGVATTSVGDVVFFDADLLNHFDVDTKAAGLTEPLTMLKPAADGGTLEPAAEYLEGPQPGTVVIGDGLARDEEISVTQGALVVESPSVTLAGTAADTLVLTAAEVARLRVGDLGRFEGTPGACTAAISGITPAGVGVSVTGPCLAGTYAARFFAGLTTDPFVVTGGLTGYMGRVATGQTFNFAGTRLRQGTAGFGLSFTMGPKPASEVAGYSWRFKVGSGFAPRYSTYIDTSNTYSAVSTCAVHLPGPIAFWLPGQKAATSDAERGATRLFVAFPSANGVMEMVPSSLNPGPASANVFCYR